MSDLIFLLPVGGGSGGAHSVMQEANAMFLMGLDVKILANAGNVESLRRAYADFAGFNNRILGYENLEHLGGIIQSTRPKVVVATTNHSVHILASALHLKAPHNTTKFAYYIQDYEPLFYERGSDEWNIAYTSYGLIPNLLHFAKTRGLQEVVEENHGVQVYKVEPSVDHSVYYPNIKRRIEQQDAFKMAAMIRPSTPRRAPHRTVRILDRIGKMYEGRVKPYSFGCSFEANQNLLSQVSNCEHLGVLARGQVGELFRNVDIFLDLSDYQAFGRTAIEAMSCGVICIVPAHGGVYEFAQDGINCFIVDVRNEDLVVRIIGEILSMSDADRRRMSVNAIRAGFKYTPESAALSELSVFFDL